jgi:hypothetical protein
MLLAGLPTLPVNRLTALVLPEYEDWKATQRASAAEGRTEAQNQAPNPASDSGDDEGSAIASDGDDSSYITPATRKRHEKRLLDQLYRIVSLLAAVVCLLSADF